MSATHFLTNDAQLKEKYADVDAAIADNLTLASEASLNAAVEALTNAGFDVHVVDTKEDALAKTKEVIPEKAQVYNAGSATLDEIGFVDAMKENDTWESIKGELFSEQDPVKQAAIRNAAKVAEYWVSSVSAITEDGQLAVACATSTRTAGFLSAQNVVVVAGTQKIVKDRAAALDRVYGWCFDVESARGRVAYGSDQFVSRVNFLTVIGGPNFMPPMGPKYTIILVKEVLGF